MARRVVGDLLETFFFVEEVITLLTVEYSLRGAFRAIVSDT